MRNTKGQFDKGASGNPKGRPTGSRNKVTLAMESILLDEAEAITRKCVEEAKGGNMTAMRLVFDRLYPIHRPQPLERPLPQVHDNKTLKEAKVQLVEAAMDGDISVEEATQRIRLLQMQVDKRDCYDPEEQSEVIVTVDGVADHTE